MMIVTNTSQYAMDAIANFMMSVMTTYTESCGDTLESFLTEEATMSSYVASSRFESATLPAPETGVKQPLPFVVRGHKAAPESMSCFHCDASQLQSLNGSARFSGGGKNAIPGEIPNHQTPMFQVEQIAASDLVFFPIPTSEVLTDDDSEMTMNCDDRMSPKRRQDSINIKVDHRLLSGNSTVAVRASLPAGLSVGPTVVDASNWTTKVAATESHHTVSRSINAATTGRSILSRTPQCFPFDEVAAHKCREGNDASSRVGTTCRPQQARRHSLRMMV
jgi:hypothetical protein